MEKIHPVKLEARVKCDKTDSISQKMWKKQHQDGSDLFTLFSNEW
jgi:hypothetical protein